MPKRDINITYTATLAGGTIANAINNSTLEYTVTGTLANGDPVNVSGTKTMAQILTDMTGAQRKAWYEDAMVRAARMAYLGDES